MFSMRTAPGRERSAQSAAMLEGVASRADHGAWEEGEMLRRLSFGLVVTVLVGAIGPRAEALVICTRKAKVGGVKEGAPLRLRTACNAKGEVQVDPDALGLRGPQGAPGLVRAYGHITETGDLDTARDHAGIVSARQSGSYTCVKLDPSIAPDRAVPAITLDGAGVLGDLFKGANSTIFYAITIGTGAGGTCEPDEIQVATGGLGFSAGSLVSTFLASTYPYFIQVP
jgi:hypothetical protein